MNASPTDMLEARLAKNDARLARTFAREGTDCFRVYDHDIPELPFTVDRYGAHVVVTEVPGKHARTDAAHHAFLDAVHAAVARALAVAPDHVVFKRRIRRLAGTQHEKHDDEAMETIVHERGLAFAVNLTSKIDTGLFLDHRNLRRRVQESAGDKSVLNLFCYTGAFTVCAAKGGATRTLSVDLSNTALDRLRENLRLNALDGDRHVLLRRDCLAWLDEAVHTALRFDIIVLDPPSASVSKAATRDLDVQRDHVTLVERAAALLAPSGSLFFSTNLRTFALDDALAGRLAIREITKDTVPPDFRGRPHRTFLHTRM
jgi:23S rRNA (cytosine1962-C5)-methyltransferase